MSWSGFVKNPPDQREKCTLCNETGHLASECPNQTGPAPAPASAPAPPPAPARSYASAAAARPITQDPAAAERFNRKVAYPQDPKAAKPNPAAAPFRPKAAASKPAAALSVSSASQPVTTAVLSRPAVAPNVPSTAQPIPVVAVSRPAAASSRPMPTWASPSGVHQFLQRPLRALQLKVPARSMLISHQLVSSFPKSRSLGIPPGRSMSSVFASDTARLVRNCRTRKSSQTTSKS